MKVEGLQSLLESQKGDAEVMLYLADESGYRIVPIGRGDAAIGLFEDGTVLLPADLDGIPHRPWEDDCPTSDPAEGIADPTNNDQVRLHEDRDH